MQDMSAHRQVDQALSRSDERERLIMDQMLDLVSLVDPRGCVVYANPAHETILGLSPSAIVGRLFADMIHEDDLPTVKAEWLQLPSNRKAEVTCRFVHADGCWRWLETRVVELEGVGAEPTRLSTTAAVIR